MTRQLDVVAAEASLERRRLLQWIVAWAGLSVAFDLEAGIAAGCASEVAKLAAAELLG